MPEKVVVSSPIVRVPDASIVALRVLPGGAGGLETGVMSDIVAALDYIANNPHLGVDIVNMSLGSLEIFPVTTE